MDNKQLIRVVLIVTALMMLWVVGFPWMLRQLGYDVSPPEQTTSTTQPDAPADPLASRTEPDEPSTSSATPQTTRPGMAVGADTLRILNPSAERQAISLGSREPNSQFRMELEATNAGAGIERVTLNRFRQEVGSEQLYTFQQPYASMPDATRPLATTSIQIAGQTVDLTGAFWNVEPTATDDEQVTFYLEIGTEAGPVARLQKLIKVFPVEINGQPDPRDGYEILVRQTLQNLTDQPLTVQAAVNGPTVPPRELEYGIDRMIVRGQRDRNQNVAYQAWRIEDFVDEDQKRELIEEGEKPILWAGASSIYFNAIVRPLPLADRQQQGAEVPTPDWIRRIVAASVNPSEKNNENRLIGMRFFTTDLSAAPGQSVELPFRVFLGPKEREVLKNDYYSSGAMGYHETLVSPFGCTWCVFQPIVDLLVWLLSGFYLVLRDWGLAIIGLVLVVRLLLHPITKRSQRSMMRMAKLGPELEKIKKKYGDDKEATTKAMQEFYREHGMAALPLGCLPLLLQMPIWIALYSTLQAEIRLRHSPFLYAATWIEDLAKPDNLVDFGTSINLWFFPVHGLNILPLLLAVVFWIQMKFQPTPQAMTPEQKMQQTMMKWMMVLLFPLFLYPMPSGLNIYILTSTLIGIWESKRVRDQFKREDEEKAAQQPTLVKDKAPRQARQKREAPADRKEQPKTGWRARWAHLQQQVRQAQDESSKRDRGGRKR